MLPRRRKISPLKFIALMLVFTVSFFTGKFIADWGMAGSPRSQGENVSGEDADLPVNRLNVLLLGMDARPGEKEARTDSIIVVSIDRDTKKIAMVSVPRDTLVEIPGHGPNKINSANALGGAELAKKTVESLLGVEIPYYVKTNFEGFKEIVDTLGGVDIEVEKRMYYPAENINLRPGMQRLNGTDALGYVRFRHDALGDISRAERQQKFLTALAKEMLRARTIIKLPKLIPQLMDAVETNLKMGDAIFLARVASKLNPDNIVTATLPGTFYNYKGISYWKADEDKAKVVLNDLFRGLKLATITGPDINVPADKPAVKKPQNDPEESAEAGISQPETSQPDNSRPEATQPESSRPENNSSPSGTGETAPGTTDQNSGTQGQNSATPALPPDAGSTQPGVSQPPVSGNSGSSTTTGPATPGASGQSSPTVQSGSSQTTSTVTVPKVDIIQQG